MTRTAIASLPRQLTLTLDDELRAALEAELDSRPGAVPEEVVREALQLMHSERSFAAERLDMLRDLLEAGIADLDRGEGSETSAGEILDRILDEDRR
jgi:Arc/MetJ-type ribon-helix-helix transcriptional regulator